MCKWFLGLIVAASLVCGYARADERDDALLEAQNVMSLLSQKKFKEVWEQHTGSILQNAASEDYFIAYHTMGRSQFAPMSDSKIVGVDVSNYDPSSKYTGKIYAVTFLNHYGSLGLYERILVFLENDRFKLGGYYVAPAP